VEKTINVGYLLGRDWWKVQRLDERPTGEGNNHHSIQQYYTWDSVRFPSCAGRRFDEVRANIGAERIAEQ